jgi:hypothetical protein
LHAYSPFPRNRFRAFSSAPSPGIPSETGDNFVFDAEQAEQEELASEAAKSDSVREAARKACAETALEEVRCHPQKLRSQRLRRLSESSGPSGQMKLKRGEKFRGLFAEPQVPAVHDTPLWLQRNVIVAAVFFAKKERKPRGWTGRSGLSFGSRFVA